MKRNVDKKRLIITATGIFGAIILVILTISTIQTWRERARQVQRASFRGTEVQVRENTARLTAYVAEGHEMPDNLLAIDAVPDAWGRPFHLETGRTDPTAPYALRSDGPDQRPHTKDDLLFPFTLPTPNPQP